MYGKIIIIVLVVTAGGAWGWSHWQAHQAAQLEQQQDAAGEQAAKNALTPWQNPGTTMNNPFGATKQ
jgi:predicted negative regulator of RcsB-dependent stress response